MPQTPDPSPLLTAFVNGFGQFLGIFLGVIAGTAVTLLVQFWIRKRDEKSQVKNLKFELDLNSSKIEEWLEELAKYRNAVNGDSIQNYFGYFKLSSFIGVTAYQIHQSGLLYKHLSHEHIRQMQEVFNDFSFNGENFLNNQIEQRKQSYAYIQSLGNLQSWQSDLKPLVVRDIDFWEQKFKGHKNTVKSIIEGLNAAV